MKEKIQRNKYIWLAFLAALIPRVLFLFETYPLSISGDEMYAMWPAAKLLGYDWSGVMSEYRYYGYGYTILLVPFMALIQNPLVLYRCMVALMIVFQALIAPISFHLLKKYFRVADEKIVCLIAIAGSYLVTVRATYTYPEFVYVLVVWLIVWVLLKLNRINEQGKGKAKYTLLLFLLMAYAYTIHSRGLALWMALIVTLALLGWIYRKFYVSIPVCAVGGGLFLAVGLGMEYLLEFLNGAQTQQVNNTAAIPDVNIFALFGNPKSWTAWLNIIVGQINESVVFTGGIAVVVVAAILLLIWKGLKREEKIVEKEKQVYSPYIVVGIFCVCTIGITIGGQSVSWLDGVTKAMELGEATDAFRGITYFRYYGAYAGPLLMAGLAYIIQYSRIIELLKGKILIISGLLQGYWILVILPLLCYSVGCVWTYAPFSYTRGFVADSVGLRSYLPGSIFVFLFLFVAFRLYKKKRLKSLLSIFCLLLIYAYVFNGMYHERYRGEINYEYTRAAVEWITDVEQETGEKLDKIYVDDNSVPVGGQGTKLLYQFMMPDKKVICEIPTGEQGDIFISHQPENVEKELNDGYRKIRISENTYAYVWGAE